MPVNPSVIEQAGHTFASVLIPLQAELFLILLLLVSIQDILERRISNCLQLAIAGLTFLQFAPSNLLGILSALPYLLVALFSKRSDSIGGGDVKLAGSIGLVLGLPAGLTASLIGLTAFVLYGFSVQRHRRYKEKPVKISFPLGPFLATGAAVAYFIKIGGMFL